MYIAVAMTTCLNSKTTVKNKRNKTGFKIKIYVSALCNYKINISAFKNLPKSSPLTFIVSASPLLKFSMYCKMAKKVTAEFVPSAYLSDYYLGRTLCAGGDWR